MPNTATAPAAKSAWQSSVETLNYVKEIRIDATPEIVFESVLEEITTGMSHEDGSTMSMKLEAWPGGRWYRDLGNNAGHFWGHVQVIKPPKLLELCGPMFMSYPAVSHVQYRLAPDGDATVLKLTHRAIGLIDPEHAKGVQQGWGEMLEGIRKIAARRAGRK
jgi:uncharacterized protein YndB with AHSA1/START domain